MIRPKTIKISLLVLVLFFIVWFSVSPIFAAENKITVYCDDAIGQINKKIFGNNLIAYDPATYEDWTKEYYGISDYGAGIWDPAQNAPVEDLIDIAKNTGISVLRFPGGCGTHHYNWKNAIGRDRKHFLFGIDEFLKTCALIGAEPVITLSYFTGNEQDAADLIEYLNMPDDGSHKWAAQRSQNGHKEPYNVRYFEIGNEDWHGDHRQIKQVSPDEYTQRYLKYYAAIKAADASVNIGAILSGDGWNSTIAENLKDKIDFAIIHIYPASSIDGSKLKGMDSKEIFETLLGISEITYGNGLDEIATLLRRKTGRNIPLAITEYNSGLGQEQPIQYRHCLGSALLNAELLRIFSDPQKNILMANYWQFNNSYWGMVSNRFGDNPKDLYKSYYKRPNYYVFELYNEHFGNVLVPVDIKCTSYKIKNYGIGFREIARRFKTGTIVKPNLLSSKWQISQLEGVSANVNNDVLQIEFVSPDTFNYFHSIKRANVEPETYYKLSGYIKTNDLLDKNGVCLEVQDARGWDKTRSASSTDSVSGTENWKYVETVYKTLPDAASVIVIARRIGESGPLRGKVSFRDVDLEKFIPDLDTKYIPYLSVNASKSFDGNKTYLIVINKNMGNSMTASIDLKNFSPAREADVWILNGPSIDATNEKNNNVVKLTQKKIEITNNPFDFTFEPHSVTAIEIKRLSYEKN